MTAIGNIATAGNALIALGEDAYDDTLELIPSSRETVATALTEFLGGDQDKAIAVLRVWQWYE